MDLLFTSLEEFKEHQDLMLSFDFDVLKKYIRQAQFTYLPKVLDKVTLAALNADYEAADGDVSDMDPDFAALLPWVQDVIAPFALLAYHPFSKSKIGESGDEMRVIITKWASDETRAGLLESGYHALELLFKFLDENREDYEDWADSEKFTELKKSIVWNIDIFQQHVKINDSFWTFSNLRSHIQKAQDNKLVNITGKALLDEILAQIAIDDLSDENKALMPMATAAVSLLAFGDSLLFLPYKSDSNGFTVYESLQGINSQYKKTLEPEQIKFIKNQIIAQGEEALASLRTYLYDNKDDYPLFTSSAVYQPASDLVVQNSTENRVIFF